VLDFYQPYLFSSFDIYFIQNEITEQALSRYGFPHPPLPTWAKINGTLFLFETLQF
jgi:hypothetical protein